MTLFPRPHLDFGVHLVCGTQKWGKVEGKLSFLIDIPINARRRAATHR